MNRLQKLEVRLLLEALYDMSGYDFRQYNRESITRRIQNRLIVEQLSTITALTNQIIHSEEKRQQLLNDFSINVTEMFRDPLFFKCFRNNILPQLRHLPEIRIWHAGCASGEEVISMAILLEELNLLNKTVLYATDMNDAILDIARLGRYPIQKMQTYTKNYMLAGGTRAFSEYYFTDQTYAYVEQKLLKNIIFAQHNLVTDQSFNEFHIIICRNVLIYFTADLQKQVLQLFDESLAKGGYLGLGDKETIRFSPLAIDYEEAGYPTVYTKKHMP